MSTCSDFRKLVFAEGFELLAHILPVMTINHGDTKGIRFHHFHFAGFATFASFGRKCVRGQ